MPPPHRTRPTGTSPGRRESRGFLGACRTTAAANPRLSLPGSRSAAGRSRPHGGCGRRNCKCGDIPDVVVARGGASNPVPVRCRHRTRALQRAPAARGIRHRLPSQPGGPRGCFTLLLTRRYWFCLTAQALHIRPVAPRQFSGARSAGRARSRAEFAPRPPAG